MSFPRYSQYKDSGVEWLGEVPAHWAVVELKHLADVSTGMAKGKDHAGRSTISVPYLRVANVQNGYLDLEDIALMEIPAADLERYSLKPGDVLMNEGGDFDKLGRGCVWNGQIDPCITQNHVFAVRPRSVRSEWLSAITGSDYARFYFKTRAKQSTNLASISSTNLMALPVVLPPADEQTAITAFLEREMAKIDALVAEQQRLIELLKEKRQATISHAVTKGLSPDVVMRASDIEWLPEVPAHWRTVQVKHLARPGEKTFTDGDWIEAPYITDEGVRLIQTGNVGVGVYKEQGFRFVSASTFEELGCTEVAPRDVLICRLDGPVGRACLAPDLGGRMITSVDNTILKVADEVAPDFVVALFSSVPWIDWLDALCRVGGGFRLRVSRSQLGELRVPLPPLSEQLSIARYLDSQAAKWAALAAEAQCAIDLLQERRAALISAAVTGQIDVRAIADRAAA
ncbi:MAG TPA: restriction endonuclease subunit S [Archangium sp.]|nr:restriction endonuclease subunit S [Archangium sp.]